MIRRFNNKLKSKYLKVFDHILYFIPLNPKLAGIFPSRVNYCSSIIRLLKKYWTFFIRYFFLLAKKCWITSEKFGCQIRDFKIQSRSLQRGLPNSGEKGGKHLENGFEFLVKFVSIFLKKNNGILNCMEFL